MLRRPRHTLADHHGTRMLASTVAALALAVMVVRVWPPPTSDPDVADLYQSTSQEVIEISEVVPTRQPASKPPPPVPLPPIEVEDEELLESVDLLLDASRLAIAEHDDDDRLESEEVGETSSLPRSQSAARLVRFVPPQYTSEARRNDVKAEIVVEVDIDERGVVRTARVVRRYILGDEDEPKQFVDHLGYGLEQSAVNAARASQYRPARENGVPVRSLTEIYMSFGI